jgi:DNA-binding MarR family transcriptional regulator
MSPHLQTRPPVAAPTFPPLHDNIGRLLAALAQDFQRRTLIKCRELGHHRVRGAHLSLISHLTDDAICLSELALRSGISQQATGKLVKELERSGYLRRNIDAHDRRARIVYLTDLGARLLSDLDRALAEVRNEYAAVLGSESLPALEHQLRGTLAALGQRGCDTMQLPFDDETH